MLEQHGWKEMRSRRSHRHFKHPEKLWVITVPGNEGKELETRRNFQDALAAHFEAMREVGEPIPEPNSSVDYIDVAA